MNTHTAATTARTASHSSIAMHLPAKITPRTARRIRVLMVDDHPVALKGITFCLARQERLEIVGDAADGNAAVRQAKALLPDIVVTDIDMPHMNGLALAELLRRELPQVKVLVLSMHRKTEYIVRAIQAGAKGYVLKDAPIEELTKAIEAVSAGLTFFSPDVARVALNQFVRGSAHPISVELTPRETEVLTRIAEGLSNKEIANLLSVGVRTVETHRERLMRKLNIHNVAGLTKFAISKGLITLQS